MRHFVIEVKTTTEDTVRNITEKPDRQHALMLFYQTLAAMMADEDVLVGFCTVLDDTGKQLLEATEYYAKPGGETFSE